MRKKLKKISKPKKISNFVLGSKLGARYSLIDSTTGKSRLVRDKTVYKVSRVNKIKQKTGDNYTYSGFIELHQKGKFVQGEFFLRPAKNLKGLKKELKKKYNV